MTISLLHLSICNTGRSRPELQTTLNYFLHAAPECLQGNPADERSDIYAVGMTLFRLVIPSAFFDLDATTIHNWAQGKMRSNLPSTLGYPNYLPLRIKKIINKATAVDPTKRYQSALEMLNDLERLQVNINWAQSPDGIKWTGKSNDGKAHQIVLENKKLRFHCRYKINGRKPRTWEDVGPNFDDAEKALQKLVSSTILI